MNGCYGPVTWHKMSLFDAALPNHSSVPGKLLKWRMLDEMPFTWNPTAALYLPCEGKWNVVSQSHVCLIQVHPAICEACNSACQLSLHIHEKWAQQELTSSNIHFWFATFHPRFELCPITSYTLFQCLNLSGKKYWKGEIF